MRNIFGIALVLIATAMIASSLDGQNGPYQYNSVTPCRVVDTRNANGTNGGPALTEDTQRDFRMRGNCGVPSTAKAVSINLATTQATATSWLAAWPSSIPRPLVSTINFNASQP